MSLEDTRRRAAEISVRRFIDEDGVKAVELDVTDVLSDDEIQVLFDGMEDGEWAKIDRALDAIEGRAPWPEDGVPDVTDSEHKAGGADRNRGNAETLRRYWKFGKGGAEIRWGQNAGNFTRCVRKLRKHLGGRAEGYCALRHKEMTGQWPGKGRP